MFPRARFVKRNPAFRHLMKNGGRAGILHAKKKGKA